MSDEYIPDALEKAKILQRRFAAMSPMERFMHALSQGALSRSVTAGELVEFAELVQEAIHDLEVNSQMGR